MLQRGQGLALCLNVHWHVAPVTVMSETQHGSCLTQAQQHCNAVQPEQRATHVRELVRSLADWAETHKALNAVIQLPLNPLEEQVSAAAAASPCYPASDCTQ